MFLQTAPGLGGAPDPGATLATTDDCASALLPGMIATAHQRSRAYGVSADGQPDLAPARRDALAALIDQNRMLHTHAVPAMETLYQQIVNTHNMVLLTDASGVIVHALGDDDFLEKANRVALQPGVTWSEQSKGTNAIGTAIAEKAPALVHADQHYLTANHFLTCSAAPISDHRGNVIGVLDVSGDRHSFHKHTMALVRMSALMIENQLFSASFEQAIIVHFHARPEFIGTLMEGIASFSGGGRFLAANRNGLFQLGLPAAELRSHSFSSLFGLPVSALHEHHRSAAPGLLPLCLHSGVRVVGKVQMRLSRALFCAAPALPDTGGEAPTDPALAPAAPALRPSASPSPSPSPSLGGPLSSVTAPPRRLSGLRYLRTGDPQLELLLDKVGKVLGRGITIMIMGETGTGKDLLAQAIHHDSPRAAGPFVAVNCASIPETLIESELFGYEDGAFTGARKKGAAGRLLQANGGTLFLDEIGDMPAGLQARLLRVLQERRVTPLGGARSVAVDIDIICATNHNLRERMARGLFREDLYYRLNGLVLRLPPLRERTDLDTVVKKVLASDAEHGRYTLSPELTRLFHQHRWPGNLRQLSNLLRTAIVMAGDQHEIGMQHMPDDFLDDIGQAHQAGADTFPTDLVAPMPPVGSLGLAAQALIAQSLAEHGGNVSATARALGVSRNTVYRHTPRHG